MSSKRLHYYDEKWLDLISECRSSGLSDKDWCMEHQIGISTFYYHVKRLRNKACSIPPAAVGAVIPCQKQEVVELNFNPVSELPMNCSSEEITATAIKISMHGIQIEITNAAAEIYQRMMQRSRRPKSKRVQNLASQRLPEKNFMLRFQSVKSNVHCRMIRSFVRTVVPRWNPWDTHLSGRN